MKIGKMTWHQVLLFSVLIGLTVWRLVSHQWGFGFYILSWWLGGVFGFMFVFGDRLIDALATPGQDVWVNEAWKALKDRQFRKASNIVLEERKKVNNLTMRSEIFVAVYLVLAFWTMTSGFSMFGRGFVLGLGLHLFFDLIWDFKNKGVDHWFWHIKRPLTEKEKTWSVLVAFALFLWIGMGL